MEALHWALKFPDHADYVSQLDVVHGVAFEDDDPGLFWHNKFIWEEDPEVHNVENQSVYHDHGAMYDSTDREMPSPTVGGVPVADGQRELDVTRYITELHNGAYFRDVYTFRYKSKCLDLKHRLLTRFGGADGLSDTFHVPPNILHLIDPNAGRSTDTCAWPPPLGTRATNEDNRDVGLLKRLLGWPKSRFTSPTNLYSALLLHHSVLPNLTFLTIRLNGSGIGAPELLYRLLLDQRNIPRLRKITIRQTPWQTHSTVGFGLLRCLLARPNIRRIEIRALAELNERSPNGKEAHPFLPRVTALPTSPSTVEDLVLCVPSDRHFYKRYPLEPFCHVWMNPEAKKRVDDGRVQLPWPEYTVVLRFLCAPRVLRRLVVRQHAREGAAETEEGDGKGEGGMFGSLLGEMLRVKHVGTLEELAVEGSVLRGGEHLEVEGLEVVQETGLDGIVRGFHDLGPRISSLRGFTCLTRLGLQVGHLLGRMYCHEDEVRLLDDAPFGGAVKSRAKWVRELLPPTLQLIRFYTDIPRADEQDQDQDQPVSESESDSEEDEAEAAARQAARDALANRDPQWRHRGMRMSVAVVRAVALGKGSGLLPELRMVRVPGWWFSMHEWIGVGDTIGVRIVGVGDEAGMESAW